ncbi:tetratricopeptide repeat protein [Salidesulfovibrio brasiliensis]|uniref:tetratricopeptide repeat protein n=1 Tax=Salidesulfovibrio brasiliensis TaxID=221711 RepID=UPI0006D28A17|nr:tetratricopeptide repeat protein [Salidesulfovibrio brasiliensis]
MRRYGLFFVMVFFAAVFAVSVPAQAESGDVPAACGKIREALDAKNYEAVVSLSTECLKAENLDDSSRQMAIATRGLANERLRRLKDALRDYSQAIVMPDPWIQLYSHRATVYYELGMKNEAFLDLDAMVRIWPGSAMAHGKRGFMHSVERRYRKALPDLDRSIELDPKNANMFNTRGYVHDRLGDMDRAIADYTEAIRLRPDYAMHHSNRGNAHRAAGNMEQAIGDFTEAIRLSPQDERVYCNRGIAYCDMGQFGKGIEDFVKALELKPGDIPSLASFAKALVLVDDPEARDPILALKLAEAAVVREKSSLTLNALAAVHAAAGRYRLATKYTEDSLAAAKQFGRDTGRIEACLSAYRSNRRCTPEF